jgi:hypothetical protein
MIWYSSSVNIWHTELGFSFLRLTWYAIRTIVKVTLAAMTRNIIERRQLSFFNILIFLMKIIHRNPQFSNLSQTYDIKKECGLLASLSNNPPTGDYKKLAKVQQYLRKTPDARKSISTFLSMLLMQYTTT